MTIVTASLFRHPSKSARFYVCFFFSLCFLVYLRSSIMRYDSNAVLILSAFSVLILFLFEDIFNKMISKLQISFFDAKQIVFLALDSLTQYNEATLKKYSRVNILKGYSLRHAISFSNHGSWSSIK